MINAGNLPNKNRSYESGNRGLHRSISAYGIVGKLKILLTSLHLDKLSYKSENQIPPKRTIAAAIFSLAQSTGLLKY